MFQVSELNYGAIHFKQRKLHAHTNVQGLYVPGSVAWHAEKPFAHIYYQHLERTHFSFWRSTYAPTEDITLHARRDAPWLGFRVALKNHIRHIMNGKEVTLMQGQTHFAYTPVTDSRFALPKGNVYEVFDMMVSHSLLKNLKIKGKKLDTFLERTDAGNPLLLADQAAWCSARILDTIHYFLNHPDKEGVAEEVVKQVITAATRKKKYDIAITEHQLENLYVVKEIIKKNYLIHLPLEELAHKAQMNLTYFKVMFTQVFGITPYNYLLYERLKVAKQLILKNPHLDFKEVAHLSGFASYDSFRRTFFAMENKTLREWIKSPEFFAFLLAWDWLI